MNNFLLKFKNRFMKKISLFFRERHGCLQMSLRGTLLVCLLFTMSFVHAQVQKNITVEFKNEPLMEVLKKLEKMSSYKILFVYDHVQNYKVTASLKEVSILDALDKVLEGKPFSRTEITDGKYISVKYNSNKTNTGNGLRTIKGSVLDKNKEPLPGVTVLIKGTTTGVVTDTDGNYAISIPGSSTSTLVFSCIGMKNVEVVVKDNNVINVTMEEDVTEVDEVVVTGYFNKAKESFTGTATSFSGEELRQVNPVNALTALSVLDPSFKMLENIADGSNPNVVPKFQIRGSSSMPNVKNEYEGDPNMPTFIMDGFEVSAEKVFDLDPNRIESMTLLKDAAATAIYGSRASNGVVVIVTKMPELGSIRLSYNMDLSFNIPDLRDYDLLDAEEKLELERAAGYYSSTVANLLEEREAQYNYKKRLIEQGNNTYWLNKPLRVAVGHKHSLFVEGGENAMRYSLDLSYEDALGVMKESGRERISAGMLLQYQMKKIVFRNQIMYDVVNADNSPYGSFSEYAKANPYYAYKDENGHYLYLLEDDTRGAFDKVPNPLYNTQLNVQDWTSYSNFTNNFSIDWYITEALRLKGNFAIHHQKSEGVVFKPAKHTDFSSMMGDNYYRRGSYQATEGKEFGYDASVILSFFKKIHDHVLNVNAALNMQDLSKEEYTVKVEGFPDENLDYIVFGASYPKSSTPTGKDEISRLIGWVGNMNYSFKERYLLDLSVRTDASSKFGANTRWAPFGSVGIGWNLHNEAFIKDRVKFINRLKITASLGWVGSQSFSPFQAIPKYEYDVNNRYRYGIGAIMKGMANRSLEWQKTTQRNVGIDFDILNRRLAVSANYYVNTSKSLLSDVTLPPSLGFTTYTENIGQLENKGFDLKVRGTVFRNKDGFMNLSVGIVRNKNKLKKISNSLRAWNEVQDDSVMNAPRVRFIEGQSLNTIWGVPSKGINPANGKEIFVSRNGTLTDTWNSSDQQPIGCTDPTIEGNVSLNGGYKGLSLSMYFTYSLGGDTYNQTLVDRVENADKRYNCDRRVLEDRWQKPGDVTFFKDVANNEVTQATSRFVEKYNWLKLSTLNVSYDFNGNWLKNIRVESLRLSFNMTDVFRWSSVKEERGLDYPFAHAFRTSLRITF